MSSSWSALSKISSQYSQGEVIVGKTQVAIEYADRDTPITTTGTEADWFPRSAVVACTRTGLLCTIGFRNDPAAIYKALMRVDPPQLDFLLPHGAWVNPPPGVSPGTAHEAQHLKTCAVLDIVARNEADDGRRRGSDCRVYRYGQATGAQARCAGAAIGARERCRNGRKRVE